MRRGCASIVVGVLVVGLAGYVYLTLNPPFSLPETGYLSSEARRDVRLDPAAPVAAFAVRVQFSSRIFANSYSQFEPARLTASLAGASADALALRLYPTDGAVVEQLAADAAGHSIEWRVDCRASVAEDCSREYVAVVSGGGGDVAQADLEIFAEQEFPAHVETPFLVSIGLDVDDIDLADEVRLGRDVAMASVSVSADAPVAYQRLDAGAPEALGGGVLRVRAERRGDAIPTGLRAPAPVRLALLDAAGSVVVDLAPRPGTELSVGLPTLIGEHHVVTWWQDRADQAYDVAWEVELGSLAAGDGPRVSVDAPTRPDPIETIVGGGQASDTIGSRETTLDLGIDADFGPPAGADHLPTIIGVLRLRLELTDVEDGNPAMLLLDSGQYDDTLPAILRPNEPIELAVDGRPHWVGTLVDPERATAQPSLRGAAVAWETSLQLWPLDPFAPPGQRP
jgi:hypothetical protein